MIRSFRLKSLESCIRMGQWFLVFVCVSVWFPAMMIGQIAQKPVDLTELSLEDLMNIEVTLVSKKPEKITEAAAAVYVLTQDDIRRSGATNIPDLLRLIPGVQVARIDENKWAISVRGFMDLFANKLLVLIDGRSVYSPVFSGVLWESQDVWLRDIDRIEVVRGPGATLWGANAVNGIINIITKRSQDTQGGMVQLGAGTEERGFGGFRYGGKVGKDVSYRIYAKTFDRGHSVFEDDKRAADGWQMSRGGFRMDWNIRKNQSLVLMGDLYGGHVGQTVQIPYLGIRGMDYGVRTSGGNMLGRWTRALSSSSEMILQLYFDRVVRRDSLLIGGFYNVYDGDFQHRFRLNKTQLVIWGLGYRLTRDRVDENTLVTLNPPARNYDVTSAFVQDELSLFQDRFRVVFGSKFEHNNFTGFEYQPNLRMLWKFKENRSIWAAVAKAVRTPSRVENDIQFLLAQGSHRFRSERLYAFELGYHHRASERFYLDWSAYYNMYDRLRTQEPIVLKNGKTARTVGFEATADWTLFDWWRIRGTYTHCQIEIKLVQGSLDAGAKDAENENPRHQGTIQSTLELPGKVQLDLFGRYVGRLQDPHLNNVPPYFELDARIGWRFLNNLEVSFVGRNLIHRVHPEFTPDWILFAATQVQRSMYASVVWTF